MKDKRVLITGGAGFLGRNICRGLANLGNEIVIFDNLSFGREPDVHGYGTVTWVEGDVQDEASMCAAAKGCDAIFHFAGVIGGDMSAEITSARVVAGAAADAGCARIVYASSCAVYGRAAMDAAVTEDQPAEPLSKYAVVKRDNETFFSALHETHGISVALLRYFNPYGPGQDERMVIPRFIRRALNGEPIVVYGTGEQLRDFVFIDDAVRATIAVAGNIDGAEVVNIAGGMETSIARLVREIIDLTGSASALEFVPAPAQRRDMEVDRRIGSTAKLERIAGYVPSTDLRDGLQRTLDAIGAGGAKG